MAMSATLIPIMPSRNNNRAQATPEQSSAAPSSDSLSSAALPSENKADSDQQALFLFSLTRLGC
jgi:hypothetical protein